MARKSKLERILNVAFDLLATFDDYFSRPRWVVQGLRETQAETEKTIWYLVKQEILDHQLNLKQKQKTILSLIKKPWDRQWRLVVFDIPEKERRTRDLIRNKLRELGLAPIQRSVWISPLPLDLFLEKLNNQLQSSFWFFIFQGKIRSEDPKILVKELWPIDSWSEEAKKLITKIKKKKQLKKSIKERFWQLILDHPKVPLDLLPKDWPLEKLVKAFGVNMKRSYVIR